MQYLTQTKEKDLKFKVSRAIAMFLSSPNALEWKTGFISFLFGLVVVGSTGETFQRLDSQSTLHPAIDKHFWMVSISNLIFGILAIYALIVNNRNLRAICAEWLALTWALITVYFFTKDPPIHSAIVMYGTAAVAEAWVYLRIKANLDCKSECKYKDDWISEKELK